MPARSLWSGAISFGIVNIPVKLLSAVKSHDIHFHQIDVKSKKRIHYRKVVAGESREIQDADIVRGFEVEKGRMVLIEDQELHALAAAQGKTLDIQDFVSLEEIDPLYFDHPYYLIPDAKAGKAYWMLVMALEHTKRAAIAQVIMRGKEDLVVIRPLHGILCLETMRFQDEIVDARAVKTGRPEQVGAREVKIAEQLIASMTTSFRPERYHDTYHDRLQAYLQKKAKGKTTPVVEEEPPKTSGKVLDLMSALQDSLERATSRTPAKTAAVHHRRRAG
jgi:DNA end-binding protein Ku